MFQPKAKYVNPFTDFGFKKIFGEEVNKTILIDFLNCLLPEKHTIADITFNNSEQLSATPEERKAVYDIYCTSQSGERFIVEIQKAKQNYFIDRTIYYATFPIKEQAMKGAWNYKQEPIYCIGILDFKFRESTEEGHPKDIIHTAQIKDQHNVVIYDKLTFIYIEIPNFNKTESELETRLDKWLYFIKNLEDLQSIPQMFNDVVFDTAFKTAELAVMTSKDRDVYEYSLKNFRDNYAINQTAEEDGFKLGMEKGKLEGIEEGMEKGKLEGLIETAQKLKIKGFPVEDIAEVTGLSIDEIQKL